jgi:hypothetical protein
LRDQVCGLKARAARAEAAMERLTKQAVFDADHIHTLNAAFATRAEVTDANARAARAEAELAAERARLRDLWCEMALEYRDERISYVSVKITRSVWDELDAAMKEGK